MLGAYTTVRRFLPLLLDTVEFQCTDAGEPAMAALRALRQALAESKPLAPGDLPLEVGLAGVATAGGARAEQGRPPRLYVLRARAAARGSAPPGRVHPPLGQVGRPETDPARRPLLEDLKAQNLPVAAAARAPRGVRLPAPIRTRLRLRPQPAQPAPQRSDLRGRRRPARPGEARRARRARQPHLAALPPARDDPRRRTARPVAGDRQPHTVPGGVHARARAQRTAAGPRHLDHRRPDRPGVQRRLDAAAQRAHPGAARGSPEVGRAPLHPPRDADSRQREDRRRPLKAVAARAGGGGEVASIDGMRFVVPYRTFHARFNRRYFHRRRGITVLGTTADHYAGINTIVVPGTAARLAVPARRAA